MLNRISKIIFFIVVIELCLGGGGKLTAIGPVSFRMILFVLAMALSALHLIRKKELSKNYQKLISFFTVTIFIGLFVGWLNNNPTSLIWEDVKPLLYFFMLIFFALVIHQKEIGRVAKIYQTGSLIIALLFIATLMIIHLDFVPFLSFYSLTEHTQEFFYRGQLTFFYKGFLFLGVGTIFFLFSNTKKKYDFAFFLVSAIVLSVTRGLLFALVITLSAYFISQQKYVLSIIPLMLAFLVVVWGNKITISLSRTLDSVKSERPYEKSNPDLFGGRAYSDEGRVQQIKEVSERLSVSSVLVGHGFGNGIPARKVHMEIAYLEVFHKQGIIGLLFWLTIAGSIHLAYRKSNLSAEAKSFYYSSLFVFVESATNQFFNNPIGMSVLLISLVSLTELKKQP
ncbi:MAG: hypothetical protein JST48_14980 [Bacteroidetes bacterium]|nr:hypothetical protein [Bacteroidota bacterium]